MMMAWVNLNMTHFGVLNEVVWSTRKSNGTCWAAVSYVWINLAMLVHGKLPYLGSADIERLDVHAGRGIESLHANISRREEQVTSTRHNIDSLHCFVFA